MANFCTQCGKNVHEEDNFCQECGSPLTGAGVPDDSSDDSYFDDKRARVLGETSNGSHNRKAVYLFGGLALALILFTVANSFSSEPNPVIEAQPVVTTPATYPAYPTQMDEIEARVENGKIIVPVKVVEEKRFVTFNYASSRGTIPLLAYVSGEGKIVTAVSMCEPCKSTRFHIRSEQMVCNSCGTTWEVDNLNGVSGACQGYPPDALPNTIVGDDLQIEEAVVAAWVPRA